VDLSELTEEEAEEEIRNKFTFHKKNQLKKHMMDIHGEGWFTCEDHCGKKFKS